MSETVFIKKRRPLTPVLIVIFTIFMGFAFISCKVDGNGINGDGKNYKQLMRNFVQSISAYAKNLDSDFVIIPQNGHELIREDGETTGLPVMTYINAIDGAGQEDLFYGYDNDNSATSLEDSNYLMAFLDAAREKGVMILVTDYCWEYNKMDSSYARNSAKGYISFAAPERDLNVIPDYPDPIRDANDSNIESLSDAKNFLYLLDPGEWSDKYQFLSDLQGTDYDVLIIDAFFEDENGAPVMLTADDVSSLKTKKNGGKRVVISYMSIGEAEAYRYYWNESWKTNPPLWLEEENPEWAGNYKVRYWDPEWQDIVFGKDDSYLDQLIEAGFDGVYLDIIDAFEYFE